MIIFLFSTNNYTERKTEITLLSTSRTVTFVYTKWSLNTAMYSFSAWPIALSKTNGVCL